MKGDSILQKKKKKPNIISYLILLFFWFSVDSDLNTSLFCIYHPTLFSTFFENQLSISTPTFFALSFFDDQRARWIVSSLAISVQFSAPSEALRRLNICEIVLFCFIYFFCLRRYNCGEYLWYLYRIYTWI